MLQLCYNMLTVVVLTKMSNKKHLIKRGAFIFLFNFYDLKFRWYLYSISWIKEIIVPVNENYLEEAQQVHHIGCIVI